MAKRKPISAEQRLKVLKRDGYKCVQCGTAGENAQLEIDHVVPVARGGNNHIGNLQVLCRDCNAKKSDKLVKRDTPKNGFFIGMGVHVLNEKGDVYNQGVVIRESSDRVAIQRFSFFDGAPTDVIVLSVDEVVDEKKVTLYTNTFDMRRAYAKKLYKKNEMDTFDYEHAMGQIDKEEYGVEA